MTCFIYCIYLFINFAKRPGSLTELHYEFQRKKKKIGNTTNKNDNIKKRQKKKCQCKNRIGEDIVKKSTTHTIEQAVQWPTSVALNTHTLKGLGGVYIINRLSEIQVVIKKIFYVLIFHKKR